MSEETKVEEPKADDVQITMEIDGNRRYLVVTDQGITVKERIPLHVYNMTDAKQQYWFMAELTKKLRLRAHKQKSIIKGKLLTMRKKA